MNGSLKFSAGRLLCRTIRNFLKECKFKGMDIEWMESSGWFVRDFIIKGDMDTLKKINNSLKSWAKKIQ